RSQRRSNVEPFNLAQLVDRVECGDFVGLGEGGVVEDGVDELVDGAAAGHDRLAEVDEFGGVRAEDVDAEEAAGVGGDEEVEHAVAVADDLAAGQFAVAGDADLVGDRGGGQGILGLPAVTDLRNRVDPDRLQVHQ